MIQKLESVMMATAGAGLVAGLIVFWEVAHWLIIFMGIVDAIGCAIAAAFFWFE